MFQIEYKRPKDGGYPTFERQPHRKQKMLKKDRRCTLFTNQLRHPFAIKNKYIPLGLPSPYSECAKQRSGINKCTDMSPVANADENARVESVMKCFMSIIISATEERVNSDEKKRAAAAAAYGG